MSSFHVVLMPNNTVERCLPKIVWHLVCISKNPVIANSFSRSNCYFWECTWIYSFVLYPLICVAIDKNHSQIACLDPLEVCYVYQNAIPNQDKMEGVVSAVWSVIRKAFQPSDKAIYTCEDGRNPLE